jgi:hypothetical protein
MNSIIRNITHSVVNWFERGDLVPLIIIISAVHYSLILAEHDIIPVAIAIGLLVDLGHYRWVRAAVRYTGANTWERLGRWSLAAFMTAIAVAYQQRYYNDWWLSLPLPALVISLAWLAEKNKRAGSADHAEARHIITVESKPALAEPGYICDYCGYEAKTQNGLNGHMRKHRPQLETNRNGREKERVTG